jgi:hypothetical protein
VRRTQNPKRSFGPAATGAWVAFRKSVPLEGDPAEGESMQMTAAAFVKNTPASTFYTGTSPPGVTN